MLQTSKQLRRDGLQIRCNLIQGNYRPEIWYQGSGQEELIAYLPDPAIDYPEGAITARYSECSCDGQTMTLKAMLEDNLGNRWTVSDRVSMETGGGFRLDRAWQFEGEGVAAAALMFEVAYPGADADYWMVPGLIYNGNPIEGTGYHQSGNGIGQQPGMLYPSGWERFGQPWIFSEESPVPSATFLRRGKMALGIFASPQRDHRDLLSAGGLRRDSSELRSKLYIPSRDTPLLYRDKNGFAPGRVQWLSLAGQWSYSRTFYMTVHEEEGPFALTGFNRLSWQVLQPYRHVPGFVSDEIEDLRSRFMLRYHLVDKEGVSGIIQGVHNDGSVRENWMSDGFLALNAEFAYYMYATGLRKQDQTRIGLSKRIFSFFMSQQFENGLFYSNYSIENGKWGYQFGENQCFTRPMGERLWNFLEAAELMEENDPLREQIIAFCQKTADFFVMNQLPDGSFGKRWSPDGALLEDTGSNFTFITWALCKLYALVPNEAYLEAAEKSFARIRKIVGEGQLQHWVDCLDSGAVDREGAAAYLQTLNALYETTGKEIYLAYAKHAAEFALTWVYAYDHHYEIDTPLGGALMPGAEMQPAFHSAGMTLVSVEHPCMDAWGARLGYELIRLYSFTSDVHYKDTGMAAVMASQQAICRTPGDYGLKLVGAQPEQMNSRDWCYGFIGMGKGAARVLIAWNQVLNLGTLDRIRRRFPALLKEMETSL